jgi:mannose-6-phosphate isomerase-like protein (cupin superfamily)
MHGYIKNIEEASLNNENFREVLYTDKNLQLVVMSLKPLEEIGEEVHQVDQFLRVEEGTGKAILNGVEHELKDGFVVVVPKGTRHNIVNTSSEKPMKLYTLYAPPEHKDGAIHKTKEEAEAAEKTDHFDGKTTEKQ